MILRQLFEHQSSTYTYLIADKHSRKAAIIDPVFDNIDHYLQLVRELDLILELAIDTHTHADHFSAIGPLRDTTGCQSMLGIEASSQCVSQHFSDRSVLKIGELNIQALHTPGHTNDSYCFYLTHKNQNMLFTGDTLLIRGTGRTDFQQGDSLAQYNSLFNILLELPDDTIVYPGHDYKGWTTSTIEEERNHNPRLQVKNDNEYKEIMDNLKLANPKLMDSVIPVNLSCGKSL